MKDSSVFEKKVMKQLFKYASTHKGLTGKNPVTAAAVVKDNAIVSIGIHKGEGQPHAEVEALRAAGHHARGSALYVTLEPCTHFGKTPPCVNAILDSGITTVVYSINDPNPLVRKNPAKPLLEKAGIEVKENVLYEAALLLNEVFFKNQVQNKPFITLKVGMSLDGKIALANGKSQYITGERSLKETHKLRRVSDAIMIGRRTVELDDPSLNIRYNLLENGKFRNPAVIMIGTQFSFLRNTAKLFAHNRRVILVTPNEISLSILSEARKKCEIWAIPYQETGIMWDVFLQRLYKEQFQNILIEGGSGLFTSAIENRVVDKGCFFIAPKCVGGKNALSFFLGKNAENLEDVPVMCDLNYRKLSPDLMIEGYFVHPKEWFP